MNNPATFHFPHIVFEGQEKKLWNPVLKKAYKNLPEERVRLQLVDWLIEEVQYPTSKISFESPVKLPGDKSHSRTDLITYNKDFKPLLLVECKAPEIRMDANVALQIARYNQQIKAPYLAITNGHTCYWFETRPVLRFLEQIPPPFLPKEEPLRNFEYWTKRGFLGKKTHPKIRQWLVETCQELFVSEIPPRYLMFKGSSPELGLANYWHIAPLAEQEHLAISVTATPFGVTKMNAILNIAGQNVALLSVSLELLAAGEPANTFLQSPNGMQTFDLKEKIAFNWERPVSAIFKELARLMHYL